MNSREGSPAQLKARGREGVYRIVALIGAVVGLLALVASLLLPTWTATVVQPQYASFQIPDVVVFSLTSINGMASSNSQAAFDVDAALLINTLMTIAFAVVLVGQRLLLVRRNQPITPMRRTVPLVLTGFSIASLVAFMEYGPSAYAAYATSLELCGFRSCVVTVTGSPGAAFWIMLGAPFCFMAVAILSGALHQLRLNWEPVVAVAGIVGGDAIFVGVFAGNWQGPIPFANVMITYPGGYLSLWFAILAVPVLSSALAGVLLRNKRKDAEGKDREILLPRSQLRRHRLAIAAVIAIALVAALPLLTIVPVPSPPFSEVIREVSCGNSCPGAYGYEASQTTSWPSGVQMTLNWNSGKSVWFVVWGHGDSSSFDGGPNYQGALCPTGFIGPSTSGSCQFITGPNDTILTFDAYTNEGPVNISVVGSYAAPLLGGYSPVQ